MNIQKYLAFLRTVECGSFTKAAESLNYTQSGISRMIADLEEEWGLSLLERSRSGVKITADGKQLLPFISRLCAEHQRLMQAVDEIGGLKTGLLRIGTFSSVATQRLPQILRAFQNDFPGIDYELLLGDYTDIEDWIAQGRVDCGFLRLPTDPDFDVISLERDPLLAVLPEDHPLADLERVPLEALCGEPFMLLEKGAKAEISELFERAGLTPHVHFTTWDDYAILSMIESGHGVSILPKLILQRIPYRVAVRELDPPAYREIGFVMRNAKTASLAAHRFAEYLGWEQA